MREDVWQRKSEETRKAQSLHRADRSARQGKVASSAGKAAQYSEYQMSREGLKKWKQRVEAKGTWREKVMNAKIERTKAEQQAVRRKYAERFPPIDV